MKKHVYLLSFLFVSFITVAQDEGEIVKRERLEKSSGVFIGLGPSFTLGKNIGDYSVGFNFEGGYLKRLNRVLSIGPSISYLSFEYDPEKTGFNNIFIGGPYYDGEEYYHEGLYFDLKGGDVSLVSLACNFKLNLVPVKDNSKISVYVFGKPFVSYVNRTEVTGTGTYLVNYGDIYNSLDWDVVEIFDWNASNQDLGIEISDKLKEENKITGGVFVGPGIELFPAKGVSIYLQALVGYTFPVSFISTKTYENSENYGNDLDVFLDDILEYPIYESGFPSVNIQAGVSFNF